MEQPLDDEESPIREKIAQSVSRASEPTNRDIADKLDLTVAVVRDIRETLPADQLTEPSEQPSLHTVEGFDEEPEIQKRLVHLFESIPDAVVETEITQEKAVVRRVNPGFESIFGFDDSEIIGRPLDEFLIPNTTNNHPLELPHTDPDDTSEQVVCRKTAHGARHFLHRHVPYENETNQYAFEVYSDIEDQKRRQAELEYQTEQLEKKRQQAEEFVSILSHDLRNPINIANGYLEQVKTPENKDAVAVIERALERTEQLLDDTLTLKRSSDPNLSTNQVPVETVATSAWELVDTGDSELRITDQFRITCDSECVSRLFENLFRNAVEHNDKPVVVRVGIHHTMTNTTRGDTETAFFVSDDGCGIPKEKRDTVVKSGETESRTSTGLGLAIVDRVAEAHGWDLRIVESVDGGARFILNNVGISGL